MFDISFGEIFIIVVAGLIIIGPRQLPQTARFLGHMVSRIQRQISGVKSEIRREMELEDLKNIQREYETAAREAGDEVAAHTRDIRKTADSAMNVDETDEPTKTDDGHDNNADSPGENTTSDNDSPKTNWPTPPDKS